MLVTILLFDGFTALDAIGPYEALQRLPEVTIRFVARHEGPVRTGDGFLAFHADNGIGAIRDADMLIVPGGNGRGVSAAIEDVALLDWVRAIDRTTRFTSSVCTGSLILAAAGLLQGRKASTHWRARQALEGFGVEYAPGRVTHDGRYVTSAGVSAGIDMGLQLCAELAGRPVAEAIELSMEYAPEPPFGTGDPATRTDARVRLIEERLRR